MKSEKAQGMVEYALILIIVAVVFFAIFTLLGPVLQNIFASINQALASSGG